MSCLARWCAGATKDAKRLTLEEPGLPGSAEWAETHAAELEREAVAYINCDNTPSGVLRVQGSHALEMARSDAAPRDSRGDGAGRLDLGTAAEASGGPGVAGGSDPN